MFRFATETFVAATREDEVFVAAVASRLITVWLKENNGNETAFWLQDEQHIDDQLVEHHVNETQLFGFIVVAILVVIHSPADGISHFHYIDRGM